MNALQSTQSPFASLTIARARPVREQVHRYVRDLIISGRVNPGDRIPSTQELAKLWDTQVATVHAALTPLVREGLLTRVNCVGTFVNRPDPKLTRVGIYYWSDFWRQREFAFAGALHAELQALLEKRGIELSVWVDPRSMTEQQDPWPALVRGIQQRKLQALIVTVSDPAHAQWLTRLPTPTAFVGTARMPNAVSLDQKELARITLHCAAEQGCRSVGLISPYPMESEFCQEILVESRRVGLTLRPEWIGFPDSLPLAGNKHEPFGYEAFKRLWQQQERPDGLIMPEDVTARGALTALLELGVKVPQDLKLVLCANETVGLFCPVPASVVTVSEKAIVGALWEQIERQVQGQTCHPITVPFMIEKARSANPSPRL